MKTSEIKLEAKSLIDTVYKFVLKTDDKAVWKKAMESMEAKIYDLDIRILKGSQKGEDTVPYLQKRNVWDSAKKQFNVLYGKKFIK